MQPHSFSAVILSQAGKLASKLSLSRPVDDGALAEPVGRERQNNAPTQAKLFCRLERDEVCAASARADQIDGIEPPESLGEAGPHFVDVAQGKPRRRGARRIDPAAGKGDNAGGMVTVGHGRPQDRVYVTLDRSLCRACRCGQQIARHGGGTMLGADEVAIA